MAIAGALAQRPQVLLLDELTTFLDGEDQSTVLAAVRALTRPGAGVTALWVCLRLHPSARAVQCLDQPLHPKTLAPTVPCSRNVGQASEAPWTSVKPTHSHHRLISRIAAATCLAEQERLSLPSPVLCAVHR